MRPQQRYACIVFWFVVHGGVTYGPFLAGMWFTLLAYGGVLQAVWTFYEPLWGAAVRETYYHSDHDKEIVKSPVVLSV